MTQESWFSEKRQEKTRQLPLSFQYPILPICISTSENAKTIRKKGKWDETFTENLYFSGFAVHVFLNHSTDQSYSKIEEN